MNFVSYAQNFEDVMLWRALKHVQHGLYIDVGAQHPIVDSVSKAFYENGWRGVHIEPVQHYADLLRLDRPDETVLQVALSDSSGVLELNVIRDTGLSTGISAVAQRHVAEHGFECDTVQVPMLTLSMALPFLAGKEVHWLKIDVEGFEEKVLRGWDSSTLRPWIMVVEATIPNSPETDFASWDALIIVAGYHFVYFDGLNRFYVADEHAELRAAFDVPPNVFDRVRLSGLASSDLCRGVIARYQAELNEVRAKLDVASAAANRLGAAEQELASARELAARLQEQVQGLSDFGRLAGHIEWLQSQHEDVERETERLHNHIAWIQGQWDAAVQSRDHNSHQLAVATETARRQMHDVHASTSWRVTAPLRRGVDLLRRLLGQPVAGAGVPVQAAAPTAAPDQEMLRELSPRAVTILAEIQQAIASKDA